MTDEKKTDADALFPISTVSERTGVHSVTLRAWERRYGVLKPSRTPKGHRLYSQHDINRVRQVLQLLEQGIPVGRVREVLDKRKAGDWHGPDSLTGLPTDKDANPWPHFDALCRRYVCKLDASSLDRVVNEAVSQYSLELVARKLLLPLCNELHGQCCLLASTRADHAFWYEFLCTKLGAYYLHNNAHVHNNGRRIIILGTASQLVHLQMLLLAGVLGNHGFQTSLLGAGCSLEHLPLALERSKFDAIVFCSPTTEVLAAMEALSRLTPTRLLVHYLEHASVGEMPECIELLPAAFGEAAQQLEQRLQASGGVSSL